MRKREIEKLLIQAVADALGVEIDEPQHASQALSSSAKKPAAGSHADRAAA